MDDLGWAPMPGAVRLRNVHGRQRSKAMHLRHAHQRESDARKRERRERSRRRRDRGLAKRGGNRTHIQERKHGNADASPVVLDPPKPQRRQSVRLLCSNCCVTPRHPPLFLLHSSQHQRTVRLPRHATLAGSSAQVKLDASAERAQHWADGDPLEAAEAATSTTQPVFYDGTSAPTSRRGSPPASASRSR